MSSMTGVQRINTDVLVIGGGTAGCFTAIKAREKGLDVTLTDKAYIGKAGTQYTHGEMLCFRPERGHKLEEWVNLICTDGEYLNNPEWVEICLQESPDRYKDMVSWGVPFQKRDGELEVVSDFHQPPSKYERIHMLYRQYGPLFRKKALEIGVRVLDRIMFCDLLKQDGKVVGAIGFHTTSGNLYIFQSNATVIATGGTNLKAGSHPEHFLTGDGEAMAYRAGAEISGMEFAGGWRGLDRAEFKQKERTSEGTGISGDIIDVLDRFPSFRVWGPSTVATLNAEGGPMTTQPWDVHCGRAPLYADLKNPAVFQLDRGLNLGTWTADKLGIDVSKGGKVRLPASVSTSTYTNTTFGGAGIWPADKSLATGIPGLYAAGNACATMANGASYVAGSAFNHAAVTGTRVALAAAEYVSKSKKIKMDETELARIIDIVYSPVKRQGGFSPRWLTQVLHGITLPYFIFQVKHGERLQAALTLAEFFNSQLVPKLMAKNPHEWRMAQETKNMSLVAEMMLRASLFRTESRGSHYREDYPRRDDPSWLAWVKLKDEQGKMKVYKEPIPKKWWPDLSKPYEERYPKMFPGE